MPENHKKCAKLQRFDHKILIMTSKFFWNSQENIN